MHVFGYDQAMPPHTKTMKKYILLTLCLILTSSCVAVQTEPPTEVPSATNTSTPVPSPTPILPTQTFTATPTLMGQRTATPEVEPTPTETLTPIPLGLVSTPTFTIQHKGFISISVSSTQFYKSGICEPRSVTFRAQVADVANATHVELFVRLKSIQSQNNTRWTSIPMESTGLGMFVHELTADQIIGNVLYRNSWVQYQFVAVTVNGVEVGRTDIYSEHLTLLECVPPTSTP
jgi:hypothetical protein